MKSLIIAGAFAAISFTAIAQTPAANPKPDMPAVATPSTPAPAAPAAGSNSFTMDQAKSRIEAAGLSGVTNLSKDKDGVWRGTATRAGTSVQVSLDYQGNVVVAN